MFAFFQTWFLVSTSGSPCCAVSSVLSPKQQRFCLFAPPLVGLSVMNKGTEFYVSRLRVCCSMVLSFTLPRSAAFRVFCIASSLYSSLAVFCSGECKGNIPCTSYSRTFTIHKYGYGTAYIFTHNMNMLEHIANNGTDTTKHTDVYNAQF